MQSNKVQLEHKFGSKSWISQRITALGLIPLVFYFAYLMVNFAIYPDIENICSYFDSPFVTIFMAMFIAVAIYHGQLGMQEIIEDYVHCNSAKIALIIIIKFTSFVSAVAGICAILTLHLTNFNFS
jgi:succinate dehydrogenase / fumarate reductase, membrane anchor subunit